MDFHLDEAMRMASTEPLTVTDQAGNVLWVGERATRGTPRASAIDL
jgi:hypothetical protein